VHEEVSMKGLDSIRDHNGAPVALQTRSMFEFWATVVLAIFYFLFFGISQSALEIFHCVTPPGLPNKYYVVTAPWLECSDHGMYSSLKKLAVASSVVHVCGIPILFGGLLFFLRKRIAALAQVEDEDVQDGMREASGIAGKLAKAAGVLWINYDPKMFGFEMAIITRRLLLAVSLAVLPTDLTAFCVSFVLLASLMIQLLSVLFFFPPLVISSPNSHLSCRYRPYKTKLENFAEVASLTSLLIAFAAQESEIPFGSALPSDASSWILLVVSIASNAIVFLGLVLMFFYALIRAIRSRFCNSGNKERLD